MNFEKGCFHFIVIKCFRIFEEVLKGRSDIHIQDKPLPWTTWKISL